MVERRLDRFWDNVEGKQSRSILGTIPYLAWSDGQKVKISHGRQIKVQIHDLLIRKDTSERRDSEDVTP
jgi:hypothetical protein